VLRDDATQQETGGEGEKKNIQSSGILATSRIYTDVDTKEAGSILGRVGKDKSARKSPRVVGSASR
jgi:hypothetical protein